MTAPFLPPYAWQLDHTRSLVLIKRSNWFISYNTSVECSINYPTILGMLVGMPNFKHANMTPAIINSLRRPWRAFAYNLVDSTGAPIATEKVFLDYLSAHPSIEVNLSPADWIAANITFTYNGNTYPTDFFTPIGADTLKFSMTGTYILRTTSNTVESYVAGRELLGRTPLITDGDPTLSSTWIDNTYYLQSKGSDRDDVFTANLQQLGTLFETLGMNGIYFPFNFWLDLPQTSGYAGMRLQLQVSMNIQNIYTKTDYIHADFPLDSTRAPNTYNIKNLDFSIVRQAHFSKTVNSCMGMLSSYETRNPKLIASAQALQKLIFDMADAIQTNKISEAYSPMTALKEDIQKCQSCLHAPSNVVYEQSEGFLQLLDLAHTVKTLASEIRTLRPTLPHCNTWDSTLAQFDANILCGAAGTLYSEKSAKMKRPLHVAAQRDAEGLDRKIQGIKNANPSIPVIFAAIGIGLVTYLLFFVLGEVTHSLLRKHSTNQQVNNVRKSKTRRRP